MSVEKESIRQKSSGIIRWKLGKRLFESSLESRNLRVFFSYLVLRIRGNN
jgi:hypothetical protein